MKINEAVECMSKIYLHRIIDSYTKDTIKPDENISRKRITSDQDLLSDPDNIHKRLHFEGISFDSKILSNFLLEALLESDGSFLSERELIDLVIGFEKRIVEEAKNPEIFKFKDQEAIKTYKTILEVALEDNEISEDERRLLAKLRNHLGISLRDHFLIQSTLNKFPKPDNEIHSEKEVKSELVELQKRGVVFYCNQCEGGSVYVVPEEIIPGVKKMMGVELSNKAFALLLNNLTVGALKQILEATELPISGKKEERIERITSAPFV